ncbi:CotH kinase family protein [Parabacteroides sp. OttesenSCG-928-O15]|nr:CotH kinase family protein [Parabacteroides sp. OttesenSCG-928-O15]
MKKIELLVCLVACLFFFSCESDKLSSEKYITSYKLEAGINGLTSDIQGVIDAASQTITLDQPVPANKDLVATFEGVGEVFVGSVAQVSGMTPNRYGSPIEYTVVAEDGSSITYTVASTPIASARMKEFSLRFIQKGKIIFVPGEINHETGSIIITPESNDWIENLHEAIAVFDADGQVFMDEKEQISGSTENDFRKELAYEVEAEDGTVALYSVRVVSPQTTGLPVIRIETENGAPIVDKENYVPSMVQVIDPENPAFELEKSSGVRGRGNTTWHNPKKPYRLKFDKKTSLFGYGAAKSWVLLANYQDPTFIMNTVAFEIARRFDLEYTNHATHVELFLNGEYKGSYVLTEQVQVNEHRVNIDEENDFFIELDANYDEDYKFRSAWYNLPVNVKSPELSDAAGIEPVREAIEALEKSLLDPAAGFPQSNYAELIDVPSLINYLLVNEVLRNRELYHPKSVFAYKRADGKIKMGPVWDFDWGFGYTGSGQKYFDKAEDVIYSAVPDTYQNLWGSPFFSRFFEDPAFREAYKARWNEVKGRLGDINTFIDQYKELLDRSAVENRENWPHYLNNNEETDKMKVWLNTRIDYLDKEIGKY